MRCAPAGIATARRMRSAGSHGAGLSSTVGDRPGDADDDTTAYAGSCAVQATSIAAASHCATLQGTSSPCDSWLGVPWPSSTIALASGLPFAGNSVDSVSSGLVLKLQSSTTAAGGAAGLSISAYAPCWPSVAMLAIICAGTI